MAFSNIYHTAGRTLFANIFNKSVAIPATLYLGLRTLNGVAGNPADATLADTLTSNLFEVPTAGTGYARIAVALNAANFPSSLSVAEALLITAAQTYTFTNTVTGVTHSFWCTSPDNSGILIWSNAIPSAIAKSFGNTDTYAVTPTIDFGAHA